jgi:hypothetical protein
MSPENAQGLRAELTRRLAVRWRSSMSRPDQPLEPELIRDQAHVEARRRLIEINARGSKQQMLSSADGEVSMWLARLHPRQLLTGLLPTLIASVLLVSTSWSSAADPLGATPHNDGTTTFRVWAPFVDAVAIKINGRTPVPLAREAGYTDSADTLWAGTVPGAKAGDKYRYAIERGGVTREFNDPRAQQLTGFELPTGFGLVGNNDKGR